MIKIITNNHPREIKYESKSARLYFEYYGDKYYLDEFSAGDITLIKLGWGYYQAEFFFAGVVIRYIEGDMGDIQVIVGVYYSAPGDEDD